MLRLLDLKKKRIVIVDATQKKHPAPGANTPDTHHLASKIDELVA